ncbi:MAG: phosphoribosylformylglycinamidine synthase I [Candidatus Thorarchaeota archaeon]
MAIAVIKFPGTNNENDFVRGLRAIDGADPFIVHSRQGSQALENAEGIIIPGGFSFGDYLRAGAIASIEEIMEGVKEHAEKGTLILGVSNGFQILTEMKLLPGVLLPNKTSRFVCRWVHLRVCEEHTIFTEALAGLVIRIPVAHAEGSYYCSTQELENLKENDRIPFRYCNELGQVVLDANPNGSLENIAGVVNRKGNVMGMMPQPERACRMLLSSTDGLAILENFVRGTKVG